MGKKFKDTIACSISGNSATATKATQDSAGQQINTTYIKGLSVNGKTITYTKGNGTTGTITTQDTNTTYSAATQSAAGLMSAADKIKLDGIATNANNYTYTLPSATSSVLGGVKIGSNITVSSGTISLTKSNVTTALGYTPPTTNTTYSTGTASTAGLTKLYTGTGTATDGTMTQAALKTALDGKAGSSHGTHLTLGTASTNAFRGDYGNTAYNHSQAAHAPSNAQKNSDITKTEIENKLTGTIGSHMHEFITSMDTRSANSAPNTYTTRGIYPEFKSTSTVGLPNVGKSFAGVITYQQWSDTTSWSGGKTTQFATLDDGRMYFRKGEGTSWGAWNQFYTNLHKPGLAELGAAPASHGTHLTLGTGSGNAFRGDQGLAAYSHSQAAHAPSNAQKNSDITKAEIEAKLTGNITSHTHTAVNGYTIWTGSQSDYNNISSKSSTTLYFIK